MLYALLIYSKQPVGEPLDGETMAGLLAHHRQLQADTRAADEFKGSVRLDLPTAGRTTRVVGGKHIVTDGPFAETKEWLAGLYLLECADEETALERAKVICPDALHTIEVRPVDWSQLG